MQSTGRRRLLSALPLGSACWSGVWIGLLAVCLLVIGGVEASLLEISAGYFRGGFNAEYLGSLLLVPVFFLTGLVLDMGLVLGIWALVLPIETRLFGRHLQTLAIAGMTALALPLSVDIARYRLHTVVGDLVSAGIFWDATGNEVSSVAAVAISQLGPWALVVPLALVAAAIAVLVARRLDARLAGRGPDATPPTATSLWGGFLACTVLGASMLAVLPAVSPSLSFGVHRKPSAWLLRELIQRVSDVDGDGFGALSRPADPDPFDGSIHAYALDLPGNGTDENGLAGDHPSEFVLPASTLPAVADEPESAVSATPHLLVIFLESFRADLLGQRFEGREVTPFLNQLAHAGAYSERAYVHSPFTVRSRAQFFGGRLSPTLGQTTLVDDFKRRGYYVALLSGQDDSLGSSEEFMSADRADHFYDARQDVDRRISRSTNKVSLAISWKLLSQRVEEFLESRRSEQPLLLYVNFEDTHFPYHHVEMENLLGIEPASRAEMSPDRADRVRATYANGAANVDRGIERVVTSFRRHIGDAPHGIVVTADHGQALYERGFLGHSQSLTQEQTRVPFVVWGIGGEWPEPLGLADVRGLLNAHLFQRRDEGVPKARFVPQPERRIFQYLSRLDSPYFVGLRGVDRTTVYDLERAKLGLLGVGDQPRPAGSEERRRAFDELIWTWEALRLAKHAEDAVEPGVGGSEARP